MADMVVTLSGDEAKLMRALQKVIDQQAKMAGGFKQVAAESKKAEKSVFDKSNVVDAVKDKVTGIISAWTAVDTAIGLANQHLQDQVKLHDEALQTALKLAAAQSGASKNLTGLSTAQKQQALEEAKKIQADTGFSDQSKLVEAIGAGYSAIGDMDKTLSAVKAAAQLTTLAPGDVGNVAAGALDVSKASGISDAEANIGFLLQAGKFARIEDPTALANSLAPTVASGVNTVKGQDSAEASREIAALFVELNQFATDVTGLSTRTATTTFVAKLGDFFSGLEKESQAIDEKLAKLDPAESALQVKQAELDLTKSEQNLSRYAGLDRNAVPAEVRQQIDEAELDKQQLESKLARARERQAKESQDRDALVAQKAALDGVTDPGTVFGRIQALQQNETLRNKFLENPFGEVAFQGGFKEILDANSAMAPRLEDAKDGISFDPSIFQQTAKEDANLSPEVVVARAEAKREAQREKAAASGGGATIAVMDKITRDALLQSRRKSLIGGTEDLAQEKLMEYTAGGASTVSEATNESVGKLQYRLAQVNTGMAAGKIGQEEGQKSILVLVDAIKLLQELARKQNELAEKQNALVETQTATLAGDQQTVPPNTIREQVAEGKRK